MKQATEEAAEALQRARDEAKRALAEQQGAFETERKRLAEQLGEADKQAQQRSHTPVGSQ